MKKALRISLIVIAGIIAIVFIANEYVYYKRSHKYNHEPTNKNIRFVDKLGKHYWFKASCQSQDGSVYILSAMSNRSWYKNYFSIIKLAPDGNVQWETKTIIDKPTWKDLLPGTLRNDAPGTEFNCDITVYNDKIYLFVVEETMIETKTQIWEFDQAGKYLAKRNIKLDSAQNIRNMCMANGIANISFKPANNTLSLLKIDLIKAAIISRDSCKIDAQIPDVGTVIADSTGAAVYITVIDNKTEECSVYKYSQPNGFEQYYKTKTWNRINNLRVIDSRVLITVKTDCLLQVVDISNPAQPLIIVQEKMSSSHWVASDLAMIDGNVYACFEYAVPNPEKKGEINGDVMVRKYTPGIKNPMLFQIQGKKIEYNTMMFVMPDKQLMVVGNSFSTNFNILMRVFATKFKL